MYDMTLADLLEQGISFQSEVRLCYYDYDKDERIIVNDDPEMYQCCADTCPIRYIYTDKERGEEGEPVIYIEVRKPDTSDDDTSDDDLVVCQRCGKVTPYTDQGGRCETVYGWLCHKCIEELEEEGQELHFQDEKADESSKPDFEDLYGAHGEYSDDYKIQMKK